MIDWLFKLPDFLVSTALVATGWYGFNYAVLAERAMARDIDNLVVPACVSGLTERERRQFLPDLKLGDMLGVPGLNDIDRSLRALVEAGHSSSSEKRSKCECMARLMVKRTDYAIHTSSFRIVAPDTAAQLTQRAVDDLITRDCVVAR